MKKNLSLILILCLLFAGTPAVFGANYIETFKISLTDAKTEKTTAYDAVNMRVNGKYVVADVPPVLFLQEGKTRTLVPVRFITDSMGAEVAWDNKTKEATIRLEDKVIVLKADSAAAQVDGKPYTLPDNVAPKLLGVGYNYRTMVPVRFVAEQLGLEVGWVQETQTVTIAKPQTAVKAVQFKDDPLNPELIFKTTGKVAFTSRFVSSEENGSSDQLIVDMTDTLFDLEDKSTLDMNGMSYQPLDNKNILSVEGMQVEVVPYRTRFVVNMDREMPYEASYDDGAKEIRLAFTGKVEEPEPEKPKPETPKPTIPEPAVPQPGGSANSKLIVIDAGHGGKDPGATSPFTQVREKELNLAVANKLERKLKDLGYRVHLTRTDDTYVGLYERAGAANALGADVFLSIHFNASTKPEINGIEMLYVPDTRDSKNFAEVLLSEVVKSTGTPSRGLIQRPNLVVIRETWMPAVMAELGYLTNPGEEQLALNETYQDKLVQGIVIAITKYLN